MSQRPTPSTTTPVRCSFCNALLATCEPEGLRIARGQLEAVIDGTFRATVVCYRCRRMNVVTVPNRT